MSSTPSPANPTSPSPIIHELRRIRNELRLTQLTLALRLHVSESCIYTWETGLTSPSMTSLEAWAAALGYELDLHKKD